MSDIVEGPLDEDGIPLYLTLSPRLRKNMQGLQGENGATDYNKKLSRDYDNPALCGVLAWTFYKSKKDPSTLSDESPLFHNKIIMDKAKYKSAAVWYGKIRTGKNTLGNVFKTMAEKTGIDVKTNHITGNSGRKTTTVALGTGAGVNSVFIAKHLNQKSLGSQMSYNTPDEESGVAMNRHINSKIAGERVQRFEVELAKAHEETDKRIETVMQSAEYNIETESEMNPFLKMTLNRKNKDHNNGADNSVKIKNEDNSIDDTDFGNYHQEGFGPRSLDHNKPEEKRAKHYESPGQGLKSESDDRGKRNSSRYRSESCHGRNRKQSRSRSRRKKSRSGSRSSHGRKDKKKSRSRSRSRQRRKDKKKSRSRSRSRQGRKHSRSRGRSRQGKKESRSRSRSHGGRRESRSKSRNRQGSRGGKKSRSRSRSCKERKNRKESGSRSRSREGRKNRKNNSRSRSGCRRGRKNTRKSRSWSRSRQGRKNSRSMSRSPQGRRKNRKESRSGSRTYRERNKRKNSRSRSRSHGRARWKDQSRSRSRSQRGRRHSSSRNGSHYSRRSREKGEPMKRYRSRSKSKSQHRISFMSQEELKYDDRGNRSSEKSNNSNSHFETYNSRPSYRHQSPSSYRNSGGQLARSHLDWAGHIGYPSNEQYSHNYGPPTSTSVSGQFMETFDSNTRQAFSSKKLTETRSSGGEQFLRVQTQVHQRIPVLGSKFDSSHEDSGEMYPGY